MRLKFFAVLLILMSACSGVDNTEKPTEEKSGALTEAQIAEIRAEINADEKSKRLAQAFERKEKSGYNGTVLIAQRGVILLEKATGFAVDTIPNTMESKFQLASLSKTFTALCIMKLVQDGKMGLDNTVKDFYPIFPYEGVTMRSLLSHRSGLPYYQYTFDKKVKTDNLFPDNQELMRWIEGENPPMMNKPDHYFAYNNSNFAVLAAIVEMVSGKSFEEYLREEILIPAGMTNTFTGTSGDPEFQKNRTYGYQNGRKLPKDNYDDILGDKGIYSTAGDLLKYYEILKQGSIVNQENLREMFTPRSFEHPGIRNYGYGFRLWLNDLDQTEYIYHTGWWKGYNTIMFFDLRNDFVLIFLSNKYNRDVYNIREFVDILHGDGKSSSLEDNILDL